MAEIRIPNKTKVLHISTLVFILVANIDSRPMKSPDFVSKWFYISSIPGKDRVDVFHHLMTTPCFVRVQVRSVSKSNLGYIFLGIGLVPRDDDEPVPYAAVSYIYNEHMVTLSAMSESNHNRGRVVYTENSKYWTGPNSDDSFEAYVRVQAWKLSSFPKPDFKLDGLVITAACKPEKDCFHERNHSLKEYPSMIVVRTKLSNPSSEFDGFMSDAVGSGQVTYESYTNKQSGYVIFGFDSERIRVWTDSSKGRAIFSGSDGSAFDSEFLSGELEIFAWKEETLSQSSSNIIQLGGVPGSEFDKDKRINVTAPTEDIVLHLWTEATDGPNAGFRFLAGGSLAYSINSTKQHCSYGGLTYAYTNTSIRIWKPEPASKGSIICIPKIYGGGLHSQCSNMAMAMAYIWIPKVSTLYENCIQSEDCFDNNSDCINNICTCMDSFYEDDGLCFKNLTCHDEVPILPDLELRARNNFINQSNTASALDDSFLRLSWYKIANYKGNYVMPDVTTIPSAWSCGSRNQVYVNGTPALNLTDNPTELMVCMNECNEYAHVLARMCSGTVHYQLGRLPFKDAAYCFDPPELEGVNEIAPAPSVGKFSLGVKVELHFWQKKKTYRPYLTFNCTFSTALPVELYYTTYWYVGTSLFTAIGPSKRVENLTEDMLLKRKQGLGVHISCGIRMSTTETGQLTKMVKSKEQFYGIKVHDPAVYIKKGENARVFLEPTAPIGCLYGDIHFDETCYQSFHMISPDEEGCDLTNLIDVEKTHRCGGVMTACKSNETCQLGKSYPYEVATKDKNYADGYQFRLQLQLRDDLHPIWRNHQIKDIMIYVTDNDAYKYKQCYSHVDPHMQTVDGYHFDNQYEGEFILYRNIKFGIEVQEKTTICNHGRAYCACAVSVRAGADIFMINTCGSLRFIGFTSCGDRGILDVRQRTNLRYQVYTPIGTQINLQMRPHPGYDNLINTDIYMAPKDMGKTEGLCGYFDNNPANDLRKRDGKSIPIDNNKGTHHHPQFSEEWRRKGFEANYLLLKPPQVSSWVEEQRDMFCYCEKALFTFQGNKSIEATATCSASLYAGCTANKRSITKQLCKEFKIRKRRSFLQDSDEELERRQLLVNKKRAEDITRLESRDITSKNITVNEAHTLCSDVIHSRPAMTTFKHRLKGIDPEQAVTECTFDVVEGNDKSWADVYPNVLDQVIETNNERDPEYVKANEEEVIKFNLQSCPRNCTGNGRCSAKGNCVCNTGFHGQDCSIDENTPLEIEDIEGDGLCDLSKGVEACRCHHFQTKNLLDKFRCKISETRKLANGTEQTSNSTIISGVYINIYNGMCCVQSSRKKRSDMPLDVFTITYTISIANDGITYSKGRFVYLFDSKCQHLVSSLSAEKAFILKESTCFISGICKAINETHTVDNCRKCLPNNNRYAWTENCLEHNNHIRNNKEFVLVLAVCVGIISAIIVLVAFIILKRALSQRIRSVSDSSVFDIRPQKEMCHHYPRLKKTDYTFCK